MFFIIDLEGLSFGETAVPADRAYVQHTFSVFDKMPALEWNLDGGNVCKTEIYNVLEGLLSEGRRD